MNDERPIPCQPVMVTTAEGEVVLFGGRRAPLSTQARACSTLRSPVSVEDFVPGTTIAVPRDLPWHRGPGLVDEVTPDGMVWVVYGQRSNALPTEAKTVRCFSPWRELWVLKGGGR